MTITINYLQQASPGYTPRRAETLHNVESVHSKGLEQWTALEASSSLVAVVSRLIDEKGSDFPIRIAVAR